jgi:hypothetical protein
MAVHEVPLSDAATRLGLTPDAVRLRLRRGKTLQGIKRGREWYVLLDDAPSDATGRATDHDRSSDATGRDDDATDQDPSAADALVVQLQSEVDFLRQEVAALQERLREAHLLAAQRVALPAGDAQSVTAPRDNDSIVESLPRPKWWARWLWWRR